MSGNKSIRKIYTLLTFNCNNDTNYMKTLDERWFEISNAVSGKINHHVANIVTGALGNTSYLKILSSSGESVTNDAIVTIAEKVERALLRINSCTLCFTALRLVANRGLSQGCIPIPNQKVIKGDGYTKFSRSEIPGGTTTRSMSKATLCDSSICDGYNENGSDDFTDKYYIFSDDVVKLYPLSSLIQGSFELINSLRTGDSSLKITLDEKEFLGSRISVPSKPGFLVILFAEILLLLMDDNFESVGSKFQVEVEVSHVSNSSSENIWKQLKIGIRTQNQLFNETKIILSDNKKKKEIEDYFSFLIKLGTGFDSRLIIDTTTNGLNIVTIEP